VTLPAGGWVRYEVTATVALTATGTLENTATVTSQYGSDSDTVRDDIEPIIPQAGEGVVVLGTDDGCIVNPVVRVLDQFGTIVAACDWTNGVYEQGFRGSVRVASGDITGDGIADIVIAPGRGRVGQVRAFIASGSGVSTTYTYDPDYDLLPFGSRYRGGVEVAIGDVDGDEIGDIICGQSTGKTVNVFLVGPNQNAPYPSTDPYRSFIALPNRYAAGVMVAAGDFTGDGIAEVVVGSNAGIRAIVRVFDVSGTPTPIAQFNPFSPPFRGGVTLSVGRYAAPGTPDDGKLDIFVGAGVSGKSWFEVYDGQSFSRIARTQAFASFTKVNARLFTAGVDLTGDGVVDEIEGVHGLAGAGEARGVRKLTVATGATSWFALDPVLRPPLRIAPIPRPALIRG